MQLMLTAILQLGKLAKKHGVQLRQSYARVALKAAVMAGRYAHAKQFKRRNRELKFLNTRLGRVIRDIGRKIDGNDGLEEIFAIPLDRAERIRSQKPRQRGRKFYSWNKIRSDKNGFCSSFLFLRAIYPKTGSHFSDCALARARDRMHRQGQGSRTL